MPVAALIVVCPAIEVKAIKGHSLHADGKVDECGAYLPIEAVFVHPQVPGCISKTDESRRNGMRGGVSTRAHTRAFQRIGIGRARHRINDGRTERGRASSAANRLRSTFDSQPDRRCGRRESVSRTLTAHMGRNCMENHRTFLRQRTRLFATRFASHASISASTQATECAVILTRIGKSPCPCSS